MAPKAVGAILIGGRSTRMGTDKALVEVAGVPMVRWVVAALEDAGLDVVTVGGPHRVPGYENIVDPPGQHGPLAGLTAALEHLVGRDVVLVAVDQPLLNAKTLERLLAISGGDAVVPIAEGHPQVTCSLYRPTCLPDLHRVAQTVLNASIRDLLSCVDVRYIQPAEWMEWGEDGRSWHSVDTPADLAAIEAASVADRSRDPEGQ